MREDFIGANQHKTGINNVLPMRRFRSLLINNVNLRMPGLKILTLAAHRHLPELASITQHQHAWNQAILYLTGIGRQTLAHSKVQIAPGSLVLVPPGVAHAFARSGNIAPLCLLIDFRLRNGDRRRATVSSLSRSELAQLRQDLAQLIRLQAKANGALRYESAALVLQVLIMLLRAGGWLERKTPVAPGHPGTALRNLLKKVELTGPLSDLVRRSGYQRDHLNRLLKRETGLTLGQYRTQQRLLRAKQLLTEGTQVAAAAAAVGLLDQSYFARWFRRQTGLSPSAWSRGSTAR
jgi:AraC family transcriptional regulator, transcriptional activator of pobA